jgi:hypothetical protein
MHLIRQGTGTNQRISGAVADLKEIHDPILHLDLNLRYEGFEPIPHKDRL